MGSLNHPRVYDRAAMLTIRAAFHDVVDTLHAQSAIVATSGFATGVGPLYVRV